MEKKFLGKKHNLESFLEATEPKKSNNSKSKINPLTKLPFSSHYFTLLEKREKLPSNEAKQNILKLASENQILIIQGETGSGKTTQIPQYLLEAGYNEGIAVTQPRRVAAMSVAKRVSEELDVELGEEVGYSIRFEDKSSNKTLIKYLTDGMLLREAMSDPLLSKYCVVIIDEAHERTLATDILFGFIKDILPKRKELKLIIMSATIDITKFQTYFNAPVIIIPGRLYPVDLNYLSKPVDDYFDAAVSRVVEIHKTHKEGGDILLFLTGEEEIEEACKEIREQIRELDDDVGIANVIPLYSTLPPFQQQKIFEQPPGKNNKGIPGRKIIVSTNIAETSITIDGIVFVVDPGFSKQKIYNPRNKMESLLVSVISQENADQRAGRAGRTRAGICYRLYTKEAYEKEMRQTVYPEILRSNITSVVLTLFKLGVLDLVHFDFIDPPAPETMMRALEMLNYLGAINDEPELTDLGKDMCLLPLEPELAKMVLSGKENKCMSEILTLAAMLSVQTPFVRPHGRENEADEARDKFRSEEGDHFMLINVFNAYKYNCTGNNGKIQEGKAKEWCKENFVNIRSMRGADDIRNQLKNILFKMGIQLNNESFENRLRKKKIQKIKRCLISGFFSQIAHLENGGYYITVKDNQYVFLHPSSVLRERKPTWVLYNEFVLTSKNYIRTDCEVDANMMLEIAEEYFNLDKLVGYAYARELKEEKKKMDAQKSDDDDE